MSQEQAVWGFARPVTPARQKYIMERYFAGMTWKTTIAEECKDLIAAGAVSQECDVDSEFHSVPVDMWCARMALVPQRLLRHPREKIIALYRFYAEQLDDTKIPCFLCDHVAGSRRALVAARKEVASLNQKLQALRVCLQ